MILDIVTYLAIAADGFEVVLVLEALDSLAQLLIQTSLVHDLWHGLPALDMTVEL